MMSTRATAPPAGHGTGSSAGVILITGAASGIGRATAQRLSADGIDVACIDVDADGLKDTITAVQDTGRRAHALVADVADDNACRLAVAAATEFGPIRGLVNVAGVMAVDDRVDRLSPEEWNRVLAVNLTSVFNMSRHTIPLLRAAGGGVIVTTSSVHAFATAPASAAYAASKGAIVSLTRQMALDLSGDRIRVVCVAPGSVDTPMSHRAVAAAGGASLEDLGFPRAADRIGRVGQPTEIAEVIAWLASPASSFVNGTTLVADGALLARLI